MRVEAKMFIVLAVFFVPVGVIYGFWSGLDRDGRTVRPLPDRCPVQPDRLLPQVTGRRFDNRPEDNPNALISEQEGDYGFFTPYSWWPLWLGLPRAICFLGLAVGWWLFIIGAFFGIVSLVGWTFEHYRGEYAN